MLVKPSAFVVVWSILMYTVCKTPLLMHFYCAILNSFSECVRKHLSRQYRLDRGDCFIVCFRAERKHLSNTPREGRISISIVMTLLSLLQERFNTIKLSIFNQSKWIGNQLLCAPQSGTVFGRILIKIQSI